MAKLTSQERVRRSKSELSRLWSLVSEGRTGESIIPDEIQAAIERSVNSKTVTYRYVLPTQILAKLVDSSLDSRSVQAGSGLNGAFDARSICHKVIVPFDRSNHSVLGGSKEPYLNNPLRIPSLVPKERDAQDNKAGFDDLCRVLDYLEANPEVAEALLATVLTGIRDRLDSVRIVYPVPNRSSQAQTFLLIKTYLSERTGGLRLQSVSLALFRTIGDRFGLYSEVNAAPVNAADVATGSAADLTCLDANGEVALGVEVKDCHLQLRHIQDKLPAVREQGVRELLFIGTEDVAQPDIESVRTLIDREFVTGQNLYVVRFDQFLESCLVLFGEVGRREFLMHVGEAIDEVKADLVHRQVWRDLLQKL